MKFMSKNFDDELYSIEEIIEDYTSLADNGITLFRQFFFLLDLTNPVKVVAAKSIANMPVFPSHLGVPYGLPVEEELVAGTLRNAAYDYSYPLKHHAPSGVIYTNPKLFLTADYTKKKDLRYLITVPYQVAKLNDSRYHLLEDVAFEKQFLSRNLL